MIIFTPYKAVYGCSVAVVSTVAFMSLYLITNRIRFISSKCVVIVFSACHFPTREEMQCKSVRRSL